MIIKLLQIITILVCIGLAFLGPFVASIAFTPIGGVIAGVLEIVVVSAILKKKK